MKYSLVEYQNTRVISFEKAVEIRRNKDVLKGVFYMINRKAKERTLNIDDLLNFCEKQKQRLSKYFRVSKLNAVIEYGPNNRCNFAKAYKYAPYQTTAKVEIKNGKFYLKRLAREEVRYHASNHIYLTEENQEQLKVQLFNEFINQ
jgi:hypothetical protein